MTRVQLGRGGWKSEPGTVLRLAAALVMGLTLILAGCSSQKKPASTGPAELAGAGGKGGLGESSLAQFQKGQLGQESGAGGPLHDIHFAYNDYTIQPQDGSVLQSNADWLKNHAQAHVQVEGHCDERGSEEYNVALGAKRAQAAKDYLVTLGIASSRISTISYGKELPLCTEHDETCWAKNRRDHFVLTQ